MKIVMIATGLVLALTGCTSTVERDNSHDVSYVEVNTPTGPVSCIVYDSPNQAGGLDCDWSTP
jgi:hypothetical protein